LRQWCGRKDFHERHSELSGKFPGPSGRSGGLARSGLPVII
jgi:hypothetical protein